LQTRGVEDVDGRDKPGNDDVVGFGAAAGCGLLVEVTQAAASHPFERKQAASSPAVMPALVAGIHVFADSQRRRRGWPGQARP
jgi:hypothetical protein